MLALGSRRNTHPFLASFRKTRCRDSLQWLKRRFPEAFSEHDIFNSCSDPWEKFSQWNFNREGLRFYFNMYSGFPFVIGYQEADVPWRMVKDKVAAAILSTPFGAFIQSCR
jgi:hypothetical protein